MYRGFGLVAGVCGQSAEKTLTITLSSCPIGNRSQEVMEHLVDSLGYLLKGHGPAYLDVFDTVTAPVFGPLLATSQPASLRWVFAYVAISG